MTFLWGQHFALNRLLSELHSNTHSMSTKKHYQAANVTTALPTLLCNFSYTCKPYKSEVDVMLLLTIEAHFSDHRLRHGLPFCVYCFGKMSQGFSKRVTNWGKNWNKCYIPRTVTLPTHLLLKMSHDWSCKHSICYTKSKIGKNHSYISGLCKMKMALSFHFFYYYGSMSLYY